MSEYDAFRAIKVAPGITAADVLAERGTDTGVEPMIEALTVHVGKLSIWHNSWGIHVRAINNHPRMHLVEMQVYRQETLQKALAHMLACVLHERRPVKVSA